MIKRNLIKIPEQKKVSPFWGGLKELIGRVMFYASIINFILIIITAYHTSIKDIMPIPFWIFFSTLSVGLLILMVFEYIIVLPSSISFSNRQAYKHDNPVRDDINKILHKLDEMENDIKMMKNDLKTMENDIKILKDKISKYRRRHYV